MTYRGWGRLFDDSIILPGARCRLLADFVAKVFWGDERKFLEPLMRFTSGDVRDHIVSSKIDHGPP
jgi:hypothetical protein